MHYHRRRWGRAFAHAIQTAVWSALLMMLIGLMALTTAGGALALAPLLLLCGIPLMLFRFELRARTNFLTEHQAPRLPAARVV
jgi:hypothetical protein